MATVRFGQGVAEMRGSIGGTTFSRSRNGATARNRTVPVNPNTQSQSDLRYLFSQIAQRWAQLTTPQREQWDDYAGLITYLTNRLGEAYTPSGRQMFQTCNTNLVLANSLLNPGPPVGYTLPLTSIITVPNFSSTEKPQPPLFAGGDKQFTLTLTAGAVSAFESDQNLSAPSAGDVGRVIVEATPVRPGSWRNLSNEFRLIQSYAAPGGAIIDIQAEYVQRFTQSGLLADQQAIVRMWTVNVGGLASDKIEQVAITA